jgi:hypothetical protein
MDPDGDLHQPNPRPFGTVEELDAPRLGGIPTQIPLRL